MEDPPASAPAAHTVIESVDEGYANWIRDRRDQRIRTEAPTFEAFAAGAAWQARQIAKGPTKAVSEVLEGTVESRTIIAALTFFKEQVLAHGPEEVQSGEWMSAGDVDVLIQGILRNVARTNPVEA